MARRSAVLPSCVELLHLYVLGSFAIAWPLFDLLSKHAAFLVAHRVTPADIVLLLLLLLAGVPSIMALVELVAGFVDGRVRQAIHLVFVALLIACTASWMLSKLRGIQGVWLVAAALLLGMIGATAYQFLRTARNFVAAISPAIIIFPAIFLTSGSVRKLAFKHVDSKAVMRPVDANAPVVMVVFDEFSLISLLDDDLQIDPIRYPNFAALAHDATWFRRASTVHGFTEQAVPAIVTGNYQYGDLLPTSIDHPYSLFTLLGGSYDLRAFEAFTQLCPRGQFDRLKSETWSRRMRSMLVDLSIVYLNVLLPEDIASGVPRVTQTWRDFAGPTNRQMVADAQRVMGVQDQRFREFLAAIQPVKPNDKPPLYFAHIYLPHVPWTYYPSGKTYLPANMFHLPGCDLRTEQWNDNPWMVTHGWQRHLLQVGFVDRLMGELTERLKQVGIYDDSLIVITADHGVSFWPGQSRRNAAATEHPEDILFVPLLLKSPHQQKARIVDRAVQTVDILPTMADILGIDLPWPVDGRNAMDESLPPLKSLKFVNRKRQSLSFDVSLSPDGETLKRKVKLFGCRNNEGLWQCGPHAELVGRRIEDLEMDAPSDVELRLAKSLIDWRGAAFEIVPGLLAGQFTSPSNGAIDLAISVGGVVQATAPTWTGSRRGQRFMVALLPETAFKPGENPIQIFAVTGSGEHPHIGRLNVTPDSLFVPHVTTAP